MLPEMLVVFYPLMQNKWCHSSQIRTGNIDVGLVFNSLLMGWEKVNARAGLLPAPKSNCPHNRDPAGVALLRHQCLMRALIASYRTYRQRANSSGSCGLRWHETRDGLLLFKRLLDYATVCVGGKRRWFLIARLLVSPAGWADFAQNTAA